MESHCITFDQLPHATRLFQAFLENSRAATEFYAQPPTLEGVVRAAREVTLPAETRRAVVEVLRAQSRSFGSDPSTGRNLDRLAAGAVAVVTGQQAGLFGGPAYSFYKAFGAIALADKLTAQGIEAVPVFWIASEDHDLAEVNHTWWLSRGGLERLELPAKSVGARVGEVALGASIAPLVERAISLLEGPCADAVATVLRECYRPEETFGTAFGKLFARVLAGRGLILLDPMSAELHGLAAPIYRRALEESGELTGELLGRNKLLEGSGFHAQVKVTEGSTLLFLDVKGKRLPLQRRNGAFAAGGQTFALPDLLNILNDEPQRFSANALLRPVVQDSVLPTAGYLGGPAEMAYFAQAQVIYRRLLGRMPCVLPRPGFTLVEPPVQRLLRKYGLEIQDVFGGQKLRAKMEGAWLTKGLAKRFERSEKTLRASLEKLREPVAKVDATLLAALENAEKKMLYQLGKLRARTARAEAFRSGVIDRHEQALLEALYPHRGLQERSLSMLPFLSRHDSPLLNELALDAARAEAHASHQVVFL